MREVEGIISSVRDNYNEVLKEILLNRVVSVSYPKVRTTKQQNIVGILFCVIPVRSTIIFMIGQDKKYRTVTQFLLLDRSTVFRRGIEVIESKKIVNH